MHLKKFCHQWKCKILDNVIKSQVSKIFSWEIILIYYHCNPPQSPISKTSILTLTKNLDFQYSRVTHSTIFCKIAPMFGGKGRNPEAFQGQEEFKQEK